MPKTAYQEAINAFLHLAICARIPIPGLGHLVGRVNNGAQIATITLTIGLAIAATLQWWTGKKIEEIREPE